jgi:hypothetical protein
MITATQIRNAEAAVTYFGRELGTSDYYLAQEGRLVRQRRADPGLGARG